MTQLYYPIQATLPPYMRLLPTGGQSGGAAIQIDAQGSAPSLLHVRVPLQQTSDWTTSVQSTVDTTNLQASANGYEGYAIYAQLFQLGTDRPVKSWDNKQLAEQNDNWHTVRTGFHTVTQDIPLPIDETGSFLDLAAAVRAPFGQVTLSNWSIVNKYSREFGIVNNSPSGSVALTLRDDSFRELVGVTLRRNLVRYHDTFVGTQACRILQNETVNAQVSTVVNGIYDSNDDLPVFISAWIKLLGADGQDRWVQLDRQTSTTPIWSDVPLINSVEFIADRDYNQIDYVFIVDTQLRRGSATVFGHEGYRFDVTTRRALF